MKFKYRKPEKHKATIFDRFAVAFLSGLIGFITGFLIWLILIGFNHGVVTIIIFPFSWVLWFTGVMALLGFLLLENFLANLFGYLWHGILILFGIDPKHRL